MFRVALRPPLRVRGGPAWRPHRQLSQAQGAGGQAKASTGASGGGGKFAAGGAPPTAAGAGEGAAGGSAASEGGDAAAAGYTPTPWESGPPPPPAKFDFNSDQLTMEQMFRDYEYIKQEKLKFHHLHAEYNKLWDRAAGRSIAEDAKDTTEETIRRADAPAPRPSISLPPEEHGHEPNRDPLGPDETIPFDTRHTTYRNEGAIEHGFVKKLDQKVNDPAYMADPKHGSTIIRELESEVDAKVEEAKRIARNLQPPEDVRKLDEEVKQTGSSFFNWLLGAYASDPVTGMAGQGVRRLVRLAGLIGRLPVDVLGSIFPQRPPRDRPYLPVDVWSYSTQWWKFSSAERKRLRLMLDWQRRRAGAQQLLNLGAAGPEERRILEINEDEAHDRMMYEMADPINDPPRQRPTLQQRFNAMVESGLSQLEMSRKQLDDKVFERERQAQMEYLFGTKTLPSPAVAAAAAAPPPPPPSVGASTPAPAASPVPPLGAAPLSGPVSANGAPAAAGAAGSPPVPPRPPGSELLSMSPPPPEPPFFVEDTEYDEPDTKAVVLYEENKPELQWGQYMGTVKKPTSFFAVWRDWIRSGRGLLGISFLQYASTRILPSKYMPLVHDFDINNRLNYWRNNYLLMFELWGKRAPRRSRLFLRVAEMGKLYPGLGRTTHDLKHTLKYQLVAPFFHNLYQQEHEDLHKFAVPSLVEKLKGNLDNDPWVKDNRTVFWLLNRNLVRRVKSMKIINVTMWNEMFMVSMMCKVKFRWWMQSLETGETLYGGPRSLQMGMYKLYIVGLPDPLNKDKIIWKVANIRTLYVSNKRRRLRPNRRAST